MENIDYKSVFTAAYNMVKDLDPIKAEKENDYFKKQKEDLFSQYFEKEVMSKKVNLQGHSKGAFDGKTLQEIKNEFEYEYLTSRCCDQIKFAISYKLFEGIMKNLEALKTDDDLVVQNVIIKDFVQFLDSPILQSEHYCFVCGISAKVALNNGVYSNIVESDSRMAKFSGYHVCQYPKGLEEYDNKVDIPSGKVMFANDLRCLFPDSDNLSDAYITKKSGYYNSINSDVGVMYNKEFWNNLGMVYVQVGNTSPNVFKDKETGIISVKFKNIYIDDEDLSQYEQDEEEDEGYVKNYSDTEQDMGRICTDLWAVCAVDYDLMKSLCLKHNIDFEKLSEDCIEVAVEPGKYNVRSFNAARNARKNTFFTMVKAT